MVDTERFVEEINNRGYAIIENVVSQEYIARAKPALEEAIRKEAAYHGHTDYSDFGMVLLCSLYGRVFCDLFDNRKLIEPFNAILGEGCIVYAYTSSSMPPGGTNYSRRIHIDCPRVIPNYITNMGAMILLDDFTAENGATWFLPYSQTRIDKPSQEEFEKNAIRLIAKAGSAWFFNARIWHAGGQNRTRRWRHALTVNMARGWMKQRIDIPRAMAHIDISSLSEVAKQKLGFYSQVPANYDEYYAEPAKRRFKQAVE